MGMFVTSSELWDRTKALLRHWKIIRVFLLVQQWHHDGCRGRKCTKQQDCLGFGASSSMVDKHSFDFNAFQKELTFESTFQWGCSPYSNSRNSKKNLLDSISKFSNTKAKSTTQINVNMPHPGTQSHKRRLFSADKDGITNAGVERFEQKNWRWRGQTSNSGVPNSSLKTSSKPLKLESHGMLGGVRLMLVLLERTRDFFTIITSFQWKSQKMLGMQKYIIRKQLG